MSNQKNQIPYVLVPNLTEKQKKQYKYVPSDILSSPKNQESFGDTNYDDNSPIHIKDVNVLHGCDSDATDIKTKDAETRTTGYNKESTIYKATNVEDMREFFENKVKDNSMSQGAKLQEQEYLTDGEIEEIVLLSSGEIQFVTKDAYNIPNVDEKKSMVVNGKDIKDENNDKVNTNTGKEIVNHVSQEHIVFRNESTSKHAADNTLTTISKGKAAAVQYLVKYKSLREPKWIIANKIDPMVNKELLEKKDKKQKESKDRKRKRQYENENNDIDWENEVVEVRGMIKNSNNQVDGRLTKHYNAVVNTKCPQKVIEYYEKHLVFSPKKSKK
ncbi:5661_t:CDS:2 [Funneliformis caledonium]|uniref:5661_t:CDS:1 n=1 Tax=Funneliformis caledonium TaxID=1117310 RepID=A0A9N8W092_9GLOM|nr:5661_t:CDS:2 [Funneliformis caledonium]